MTALHDKMEASDTYKNQMSDKDTFINLFKDKNLVYVLAVMDESTTQRDIKILDNFKKIKSNVAKFSLKELIEKMMSKGFTFKITQITKA